MSGNDDQIVLLKHQNDILRMISTVNHLSMRSNSVEQFFSESIDHLGKNDSVERIWGILLDKNGNYQRYHDTNKEPVADEFFKMIAKNQFPVCVTEALKNNKRYNINIDICKTCQNWKKSTGLYGFSISIKYLERVFGVIVFYLEKELIQENDVLNLLYELSEDFGYAIHNIEFRNENEIIQEKLIESEQKYREMFETTPVGIFRTTLTGKALNINNEMAKILNVGNSEAAIRHYTNLGDQLYANQEDRQAFIQQISDHGKVNNFQYQAKKYTGETIWLTMNAILNTEKGFIDGFTWDITKEKELELEIRKSEEHLRTTINSIGDGVIVTNKKGEVININNIAQNLTGYNFADAINKPLDNIFKILNSKTREITINPISRVLKTGKIVGLANHTVLISKNGKEFQIADSAAPIKNNKDEILGVVLVFRDVTKEYHLQEELRINRRRLQFIIEGGNLGTYIWYVKTGKTFFNHRWADILGYTLEELEPISIDTWSSLTHPDDLIEANRQIKKLFNHEIEHYNCELRMKHKDGHWVWILDIGKVSEWDENGNPVVMSGIHNEISDLKDTEKRIQESQGKYKSLFSNMLNAFALHEIVLDKDNNPINYRFVEVNQAFENMTGLKYENIKGKLVTEALPGIENDPADWIGIYGKVATTGEEIKFENHIHGTNQWFKIYAYSPQKNMFATIFEDISDRKGYENELKSVHEIYQKTIENAQSVPYKVNFISQNYDYISEKCHDLFGIRKDEMSFEKLRGLVENPRVTDTSVTKNYSEYNKLFKQGKLEKYQVEFQVETENQGTKWISDRSLPIFEDGKVIGSMGILQDITELKLSEIALRKSEERFKLAVEGTKDGLWDWNLATDYVYHSERFATMLGFEYGDLPFSIEAWKSLLHPDDREQAYQKVDEYLEQKISYYSSTFRLRCKDGSYKWITGRGKALFDENNKAYRFVGFNSDVSEEKKTEETQKMLELQIRKSQKLETLGTLAGGIAHDFNNILTPIMGYSDMAKNRLQPGEQFYDVFDEIFSASLRARDLIYQMLNFSRQSEHQRSSMDMTIILKEVLKLIRPSIPVTIEIIENINSKQKRILGDPTKIHQVVMNLCTNAYQAMEAKGGKLTIELKPVIIDEMTSRQYLDLNAGEYLKLVIADTGIGMEDAVRERIFEPFFTTKDVNKGTGLGLAVVHGIVQSHDGAITVYSEKGKGSTFNVFFPVINDDKSEELTKFNEIKIGSESILIVDDKISVTKILSKMLNGLGYDTTIINSSTEGLQIFKENKDKFQMIITDLTMPEMTGLQLATEIHKIKADVPIIMVTGYGNQVKKEDMEKAGINRLIGKPILLYDLSNSVREILDN